MVGSQSDLKSCGKSSRPKFKNPVASWKQEVRCPPANAQEQEPKAHTKPKLMVGKENVVSSCVHERTQTVFSHFFV